VEVPDTYHYEPVDVPGFSGQIETERQLVELDESQLEAVRPTKEMQLLAELRKRAFTDEVQVGNEDGQIEIGGQTLGGEDLRIKAITHKRARLVWLYKPTGEFTAVPGDNYLQCLEDGWSLDCPDCHTNCKRADWGCARQPEPRFRPCPVCGMKFHELKSFSYDKEADKDPLRIVDDEDENMTEMDSRARRQAHMYAYHPEAAAAFYAAPRR
jgi:hypothetical protein